MQDKCRIVILWHWFNKTIGITVQKWKNKKNKKGESLPQTKLKNKKKGWKVGVNEVHMSGICCNGEVCCEYENTLRQILHPGFIGKRCGWGINSFRAKLHLVVTTCGSVVTKTTRHNKVKRFTQKKMTDCHVSRDSSDWMFWLSCWVSLSCILNLRFSTFKPI